MFDLRVVLFYKYFPIILQLHCCSFLDVMQCMSPFLNFVLLAGEGESRKSPEGIPLKGVGQGSGAQQWCQWSNP